MPKTAKPDWHHLTHKTTGEQQVVCDLAGWDLNDWTPVKLAREPKPAEDVVDGKIKANADKGKKAAGASSIAHLTLAELTALIDARIAAAPRP